MSATWDRSGCRERVCYCHDDSVPPHRVGIFCSGCGCRSVPAFEIEPHATYDSMRAVLGADPDHVAATPPTSAPAARGAETARGSHPPANAQRAGPEPVRERIDGLLALDLLEELPCHCGEDACNRCAAMDELRDLLKRWNAGVGT